MSLQLKIDLDIKSYDIDIAGHVNNIVYVRWLEDLRNLLFNKLFDFPNVINEKYYPVVVSTNINYRKQLKLFDKPIGIIELASINHGVIFFDARIELNNQIIMEANQKCVMINLKNSKMLTQKELQVIRISNE